MAVAVVLVCGLPSVAAAQHVVNTTVDHAPDGCAAPPGDCTIRDAIADPTAIEVQIPSGDYELTQGELRVGRDVIIRGVGSELPTIRPDEEVSHRVLRVEVDWGLQLSRVRITGGRVRGGSGGGILVEPDAIAVLTDTEVSGNRASRGGGIWAIGTVRLERSLVADNVAEQGPEGEPGHGGGIGLEEGSAGSAGVRLVNTTVSGNQASHLGGGIFTQRSMTLENVSIVNNTAPPRGPENIGKGGGLYQLFPAGSGLRTTSRNTLVARNINGGCGGTAGEFFIDSENGLIDEPLPSTTCNAVGDDNLIVPDAFIGPLADNGGPTRTHELLGNSDAIDNATDCDPDDQRGVARPFGPECDIGAYERDSVPDVNVFTDGIDAAGCTGTHCTLRERIEAAVEDDVIVLQAGTYVLSDGQLDFEQDMEIHGAGARATTIDADRTSRVGYVEEGAIVTITDLTVTGGDADAITGPDPGQGGAFRVDSGGVLDLVRTALIDNVAFVAGGAISNVGRLGFIESLAFNNRVEGNNPALGGAIWSIGQGTTVFNSTISGNAAIPVGGSDTRGGGMYVVDASTIEHTTITGNSAEEGAGFFDASGNSSIVGTIIAGNVGGPQCDDPSIATVEEHHNLSSDTSCQFDAEGDRQGVDPLLGPLADNGGPTDTHALNGGSPAVDGQAAAFCPPSDQRLFPRESGPCDIGAYELGGGGAGLRVITTVVNDEGGTANASDFLVHVRSGGSDVPGSPQTGQATGTDYTLAPGAYVVAADPMTGYDVEVSGDCGADGAITLGEGSAAECTLTFEDFPPTASLDVTTVVENDQGGRWLAEDFTVHVTTAQQAEVAGSPRPGSDDDPGYALYPDSYVVRVEAARGYVAGVSGNCAADGTVSLADGEHKACTLTLRDEPLDPGIVVDGYGPTRTDADWGIAETFLSTTRSYLRDPGAFGPQGTVPRTLQVAPGIRGASERVLDGVDVFFTGWVPTGTYSGEEKQELRDFVLRGGTLIATTDDTGHTMVDAFGLTQGDGSGNPTVNTITDTAHPIANGPFGAVTSFNQYAATGHYTSLGPDARAIGGHAEGPALAVIERGRLGPGSGAVIFVADVDVFSDASGGAVVNATLIKNIFAFAAGHQAPPASQQGGGGNQQPPPPPPGDEGTELPPPVAGKNVNAAPAGGTVRVKVKGTRRFVELEEGQQIPVGSEIDTRNGRVTLEAAGGSKATFYDGLFRFDQGRGAKPLTTLTLIEKLSCPRRGKASAAAKRKKKRRLWGDGNGKFRTDGEFSSATVRGTKWLTEDRCESTLTDVRKGRVAVRDFVKRKTVIVRAGKTYVAKRRK